MGGWISINLPLCFPGDAQVQLKNGQSKRMDQLQLGDQVLVARKDGSLCYDSVYSFIHREENTSATYREIYAGDLKITLSDYHLIYRVSAQTEKGYEVVPAHEIKLNDQLFLVRNGRILSQHVNHIVDEVSKVGVYAPVTFNGSIVVDGVVASCYAQYDKIKSQRVAHAVMMPLRMRAKMRTTPLEQTEMGEGWNRYCLVLGKGVYPVYKLITSS